MTSKIIIKPATSNDVSILYAFIRELAEYEKLGHEVIGTEEILKQSLFGSRAYAEAIIANVDYKPAGFALYFHNFSTFLCRPGLYIEDLYVKPAFRSNGLGKKILNHLAKLAKERNCGRIEWWVLDWNAPAIEFYKRIGAEAMDQWTVYRLTGDTLNKLSE